ncbi:hypothetical protein BH20GEM1_BH20GEM1_00660 [soil metagenome]
MFVETLCQFIGLSKFTLPYCDNIPPKVNQLRLVPRIPLDI